MRVSYFYYLEAANRNRSWIYELRKLVVQRIMWTSSSNMRKKFWLDFIPKLLLKFEYLFAFSNLLPFVKLCLNIIKGMCPTDHFGYIKIHTFVSEAWGN